MRAKVLGAAIAAMACGWAGGARAALVSETLTIDTDRYGTIVVKSLPMEYSTTLNGSYITSQDASGFTKTTLGLDAATDTFRVSFDLLQFAYVYLDYGAPQYVFNRLLVDYTLKTSKDLVDDVSFTLSQSDILSEMGIGNYELYGFNTGGPFTSFSITGLSFVVTPVPLPASAPLFGAAILALGTASYGLKRRKAA